MSSLPKESRLRSNSAATSSDVFYSSKGLFHDIYERGRSHSLSVSTPRESSIGKLTLPLSARMADGGRIKVDTGISGTIAYEIQRLMRQHKTLVGHLQELHARLAEREKDPSGGIKNEEILKRLEQEAQKVENVLVEKRRHQLAIFKELKRRELKRKACFNWPKAKQLTFCKVIPNYWTVPLMPGRFIAIAGPDIAESEKSYPNFVGARTVSTYPMLVGPPGSPTVRQGDPICDRFHVHLLQNRTVISVADGCSWGKRPAEAATNASTSFMRYMRNVQDKLMTTRKCARYLIRAFAEAHDSIVFGKKDLFEAGTTTLIGGVILELDGEPISEDEGETSGADGLSLRSEPQGLERKWGFVCASVGDCKAFHWSAKKQTVRDITSGNRTNPLNASDCGGRLGPHLEGGLPDLRNFGVTMQICEEGDIVMVMSDGVHDNLDPQHIGKTPKELGLTESVDVTWADLPTEVVDETKEKYREKLLYEKIVESTRNSSTEELRSSANSGEIHPSPEEIMRTVIKYCVELTFSSRDFMENNPGKKLQDDYVKFPGKMDHTTFIAVRIGDIWRGEQDDEELVCPGTPKGVSSRGSFDATAEGLPLRQSNSFNGIVVAPIMENPPLPPGSPNISTSGKHRSGRKSFFKSKDKDKDKEKEKEKAAK